jgi:glutathionylspermidine synthase
MKLPWSAGKPLPTKEWKDYRERVLLDCHDCGIEPHEYSHLARFPLLIEGEEWLIVTELAERLAEEALAAEQELITRYELHEELGVPVAVRRVLRECSRKERPRGSVRVMRSDFHFTPAGWKISEVNVDYLGGFIEASSFTELMAPYYPGFSPPPNLAAAYAGAIRKAVGEDGLIGIVRRPSISGYRGVKCVAREIRRHGMRLVMMSPGQISWRSDFAEFAGSRAADKPDLLIRFHYVNWLPRLHRRSQWVPWFCGGRTHMSNPGSCVLTQSKRFPLVWDKLRTHISAWRLLLPETRNPCEVSAASEKEWVFKSVYGWAGNKVAIAGVTDAVAYKRMVRHARHDPAGWVAQRRFESVAVLTPEGPRHICLGVYTVDGHAAGAYARMTAKPLVDRYAEDVAVLVRGRRKG